MNVIHKNVRELFHPHSMYHRSEEQIPQDKIIQSPINVRRDGKKNSNYIRYNLTIYSYGNELVNRN